MNGFACLHRSPTVRVEASISAISTVPQREALSRPVRGEALSGRYSGSVWL